MSTNIGYWEQVLQAPTEAYQELFDAERKYLLKEISKDSKVLDIGCGEGRNMKTIFERTTFVSGIDNDKGAVVDARKNFSDSPSTVILQAEAVSLPFPDESFDFVTFLMILPNLDIQKDKALSEVFRVLKKGGSMILSSFSETAFDERMKIYNKVKVPIEKIEGTKFFFDKGLGANTSEQFSLDEIIQLTEKAGFKIVDHQKVSSLAYICKLIK